MSASGLVMYTIYHQPELEPPYRVRQFEVISNAGPKAGPVLAAAWTLDEVRAALPPGVDVCFTRDAGDPPEIVETWM